MVVLLERELHLGVTKPKFGERCWRKNKNVRQITPHPFFSFDGVYYQSVENSKYSHVFTLGLANYRGNGLTTGCGLNYAECSFETEILDMTTLKWSDGPEYPFGS